MAPARSEPHEYVLPSGLRVIIDPDPLAQVVAVVSLVRGGAAAEPAERGGLANLVQHLACRAVDPGFGGQTRNQRLIRLAASHANAETRWDFMAFHAIVPSLGLRDLLTIEAQRLTHPLEGITDATFELERREVESQMGAAEDFGGVPTALDEAAALSFPLGHPYAHGVGGSRTTRRDLSLADARAYARVTFRPERVTLVVSGAVAAGDIETVTRALPAELVTGLGDGARSRMEPDATAVGSLERAPTPLITRVVSGLALPELVIDWTLPGSFGSDGPALAVLAAWAARELTFYNLRTEPRLVMARAGFFWGLQGALLDVHITLNPGADPARVAELVESRLASLGTPDLGATQTLWRIQREAAIASTLRPESLFRRAYDEAIQCALTGRLRTRAQALAEMGRTDQTHVSDLARQLLTRERAHLLFRTPADTSGGVSPRAGRDEEEDGAVDGDGPNQAGSWDLSELAPRLRPVGFSGAVARTLSNGVTLIVLRRPGTATANAWLGFRGGYSSAVPPILAGLATLFREDGKDASLGILSLVGRSIGDDASHESIAFDPDWLREALGLLFLEGRARLTTWPSEVDLKRMVETLEAAEGAGSPLTIHNHAFQAALYPDHVYGRALEAAPGRNATRGAAEAWLTKIHNPNNTALVVVGDVDPQDVWQIAERTSGKAPAPPGTEPPPAPPAPRLRPGPDEHTALIVTDRPSAKVNLVQLGCLLPPVSAGTLTAHYVLSRAMERRLELAMRAGTGETEGVSVRGTRLRGGAAHLVATLTADDQHLAPALTILRSEWLRWGTTGFDDAETNLGRWQLAGEYADRYGTGDALARSLFNQWNEGLPLQALDLLPAQVVALRPRDLDEIFRVCRANAVLAIVGRASPAREALAATWPAGAR
jgi:zinc protease